MTLGLIIFYYLIAAVVDVLDKVLISAKKVRPLSYAFYTVVTGLVLLVIWPWNFEGIASARILIDLLSGALFSLVIYVFFKAMSQGEVSRVVPFIFALVPVFDMLIAAVTGRNTLSLKEFAAMWLLIPGALLIVYRKHGFIGKHVILKVASAFLWSLYFALWQYAAQSGNVLNHLMWNRVGAALALLVLLVLPAARKNIFGFKEVKNKKQTGILFLTKQAVGGANFIFLSYLLVIAKISIVNGLQGFRYIFLFASALALSHYHKHLLEEEKDKYTINQKIAAIVLIFIGTIILFV